MASVGFTTVFHPVQQKLLLISHSVPMLRLNLGLIPRTCQVHPQLGLGDENDIVLARDGMTVAPEVQQEEELTTGRNVVPRTRPAGRSGAYPDIAGILIHRREGEASTIVCLVP